jgi:hypothetical protein
MTADEPLLRTRITPEQRASPLIPHIDPGMVNHRRAQLLLGERGMAAVDEAIRRLPPLPDWQREVRIDHIYTEALLAACRGAMPLAAIAAHPAPEPGMLASSTELVEGSPDVYTAPRIRVRWHPQIPFDHAVFFDMSTAQIRADTLRSWLDGHQRRMVSFVAVLDEVTADHLVFGPLVMGGPWLLKPAAGVNLNTMFLHYEFFEHFVEDIDEFRGVKAVASQID